jgi:hypothetical protein
MRVKLSSAKTVEPETQPDGQIVDDNGKPTGASIWTEEVKDEALDDAWRAALAAITTPSGPRKKKFQLRSKD